MKATTVRLAALLGWLALTAARCVPPQTRADSSVADVTTVGAPHLDAVRPDSVVLPYGGVVTVTLVGRGFIAGTPGQNTVRFDGVSFTKIAASSDGRRINFTIPDQISYGGEAPPARLLPGVHSLSVETTSGKSNAIQINVYR